MLRLGVNIDHVATIRNARGTPWPDPLRAALIGSRSLILPFSHWLPAARQPVSLAEPHPAPL